MPSSSDGKLSAVRDAWARSLKAFRPARCSANAAAAAAVAAAVSAAEDIDCVRRDPE